MWPGDKWPGGGAGIIHTPQLQGSNNDLAEEMVLGGEGGGVSDTHSSCTI